MGRREKLLDKAKNSPQNISFQELRPWHSLTVCPFNREENTISRDYRMVQRTP